MGAQELLPSAEPVRFVSADGTAVEPSPQYEQPSTERLVEAYRRMVLGRRFDQQATSLVRQGRLAVYPSAAGQEACQIGAGLAMREGDWLFPTYRDSMALIAHGVAPAEVLELLRGSWHCGYDPHAVRVAPQCTPLATQLPHAAGMAFALRRNGSRNVAVALTGDGGTSEGDFHEALNFAAVARSPVVFLVQNNQYAISVPLAKQTAAPSLAHKGIGYGIPSEQVDGNDPVAVLSVMDRAVARARQGDGPFLVEAHTYRMDAHTNADDATRYRSEDEVAQWRGADPLHRLETYLRAQGAISEDDLTRMTADAATFADAVRSRMHQEPEVRPLELFEHVYAQPTGPLAAQRDLLAGELAAQEA